MNFDAAVTDRVAAGECHDLPAVRVRGRRSSPRSTSARSGTAAAELETLVQLGTELERAHRFDEVMEVLVHHSCSRLGFARLRCSCAEAIDGRESSTTARRSPCWRRPTAPRRSCGRRGSAVHADPRPSPRRRPARLGAPRRAQLDRRARHRRGRDHRGRGRRMGWRRRREHARAHGAGVRAIGDARRAARAQRRAPRRRSSGSRRATGSPGSRTVDCSRSRSSARPRGRAGSARPSACSSSTSTTSSRSTTRTAIPRVTRCSARSAPRSRAAPRRSTLRRATAATSSSCSSRAATRSTRAASPTASGRRSPITSATRRSRVSVGVATMPDNALDSRTARRGGRRRAATRRSAAGRDRIHASSRTAEGLVRRDGCSGARRSHVVREAATRELPARGSPSPARGVEGGSPFRTPSGAACRRRGIVLAPGASPSFVRHHAVSSASSR